MKLKDFILDRFRTVSMRWKRRTRADGTSELRSIQERTCRRFGAVPEECPSDKRVGMSLNVRDGVLPINGIRSKSVGNSTGWYIWAGEYSADADFFETLCVSHLPEWCPQVLPYLLLPPGWRIQIAPGHEDVWFDRTIADSDGD